MEGLCILGVQVLSTVIAHIPADSKLLPFSGYPRCVRQVLNTSQDLGYNFVTCLAECRKSNVLRHTLIRLIESTGFFVVAVFFVCLFVLSFMSFALCIL